jgi:hypothetical protein
VEISERAETKKTVQEERKRYFNSKDMSSSDDDSPSKKGKPTKARNFRSSQDRKEFYCKEHGPNSTHNSSDCKVIHGRSSDKQAWKNKDKPEKHAEHRSKHKNKARELNILRLEAKEAKAKWTKACKNLEAKNNASSSESEGEHSEQLKSVKETVREDKEEVFHLESSSNSSSSDSDSEQDAGCRENYVSESTSKIKNKTVQKECETNSPHHKHIDEAIDNALLLSDLREPAQTNAKTDEEGQTLKKSKLNSLSPILFVKIQCKTGKKNRQTNYKIVKSLVDSGASKSIMTLKAAKGLPASSKTETKKWSTAAGMLNTTAKTKRLEFRLLELNANRNIEKSFHVADIDLKNYDVIVGRDLIASLQLDIEGGDMSIKWDHSAIPWRSITSIVDDMCLAEIVVTVNRQNKKCKG